MEEGKEESLITKDTESLLHWRVWLTSLRSLAGAGIGFFVLGLLWALFFSIPPYTLRIRPEDLYSHNWLMFLLIGLGVLPAILGACMFLIGFPLYVSTAVIYNIKKRSILKSKTYEENVVDNLLIHIKNKNYGKSEAAIRVLGDIANKRAIDVLVPVLNEKKKEIRHEAAHALDKLKWEAKNDTEKAQYLIAKEEWNELVKLGGHASDPLVATLKDNDEKIKQNVLESLKKIGDINAINEALKLSPQDVSVWNIKCNVLNNLGNFDEAIKASDEVIRLDPKYADAWFNKGFALSSLGKLEMALACFDEAIRINPKNAAYWYNKGVVLKKLGRKWDASTAFVKAKKLGYKD